MGAFNSGFTIQTSSTLSPLGYPDVVIRAMIADGYVPIASPADLNAIRAVQTERVFASGTPYETTVTTLGLAGKYLQVADIDMYAATRAGGSVYINTAAQQGWAPLGGNESTVTVPFYGKYDGAGFIINGLYSGKIRPSLFGNCGASGYETIIQNVVCLNAEINAYYNSAYTNASIISIQCVFGTVIRNCYTSGIIKCSSTSGSFACGVRNGSKIQNCFSSAELRCTGTTVGGIAGQTYTASRVENCIYVGRLADVSQGNIIGYPDGIESYPTDSYSCIDTKGNTYVAGDSRGLNLTMGQLLEGDNTNYLLGYDTGIWKFITGKYPTLRIMGEMPGNKQPVQNLTSEIVTDKIRLAWDSASGATGYNIYVIVAGIPTKVNTEIVTGLTYDYTPTDSGSYELLIRAVYDVRGFTDEGSNSISIMEQYYLMQLVKLDGNNIVIADARNQTYTMTIEPAVAKEYEEVEAAIAIDSTVVTNGEVVGDWLGIGTVIERVYDDAKRTINQTITVTAKKVEITADIIYKQTLNIEYEGFVITTVPNLSKFRNAFGSGSGQCIIGTNGMYFHNGNSTPHHVIADLNTDFKYREYAINDTEAMSMYIVDGETNVPVMIMTQPNGCDATLTISNHADSATLAKQRAINMGTSNPSALEYGQKGLTARGIKACWSVFATTYNEANPGFLDYVTDEYKDFLIALKNAGQEIVPHAMNGNSSMRVDVEAYLDDYVANFGTKNWIDHNLGGGISNSGVASKGWDVTDITRYILNIFETDGVTKAWAYVDSLSYQIPSTILGFPHNLGYINDHVKLPSGEHLFLWSTSNRPFSNGWLNLEYIIRNCECVDAHEYLQNNYGDGTSDSHFISDTWYDNSGTLKITSGFDKELQRLKSNIDAGKIWNPTVSDWVEYFKLLKKVTITLTGVNEITVNNSSGAVINGFSMLIAKKSITPLLNLTAISKKEIVKGTVCWADLPTGESILTF